MNRVTVPTQPLVAPDLMAALAVFDRLRCPVKTSEVADYTDTDRETALENLCRLEGLGLVEVKYWRLTAEGRARLGERPL